MSSSLVPMTMHGISMAPWLMPGDVLMVDRDVSEDRLALGDVIVVFHEPTKRRIVHRVVGLNPLRMKGDRLMFHDPLDETWKVEGRVTFRTRNGVTSKVRPSRFLCLLSQLNCYPGQNLPQWMARSRLLGRG